VAAHTVLIAAVRQTLGISIRGPGAAVTLLTSRRAVGQLGDVFLGRAGNLLTCQCRSLRHAHTPSQHCDSGDSD
jgi:hypothetical protein